MNPEVSSTHKATAENYAAFILSLAGGTLITISSILGFSFAMIGRPYYFWGFGGMMDGYSGYSPLGPGFYSMMSGVELIGLVSGLLVLTFAILMKSGSKSMRMFGILVLAFSFLSLIGTGGFFVGALLGILGGILALTSSYKL